MCCQGMEIYAYPGSLCMCQNRTNQNQTAFVMPRLFDIYAKYYMLTGTVEKFKKNNRFANPFRTLASQIYDNMKMFGFPAKINSSAKMFSVLSMVRCDSVSRRIY